MYSCNVIVVFFINLFKFLNFTGIKCYYLQEGAVKIRGKLIRNFRTLKYSFSAFPTIKQSFFREFV